MCEFRLHYEGSQLVNYAIERGILTQAVAVEVCQPDHWVGVSTQEEDFPRGANLCLRQNQRMVFTSGCKVTNGHSYGWPRRLFGSGVSVPQSALVRERASVLFSPFWEDDGEIRSYATGVLDTGGVRTKAFINAANRLWDPSEITSSPNYAMAAIKDSIDVALDYPEMDRQRIFDAWRDYLVAVEPEMPHEFINRIFNHLRAVGQRLN